MIPELRGDYPGGNQIADDPPVFLFDDFLSSDECAHLVELSEPHMTRAVVSGGIEGVESNGRTGGVNWVAHDQTPTALTISTRIADLVGLPLVNAEALQVINYGPGEEYRPHYDAWEAGTETGDRCLARGGQRLVTCLIYLGRVDAGGGTFFPRLDIEVLPRSGRMVLFHNCYAGTSERHPGSLHGGMPPEAGTKWACNLWFRAESFRDANPPTRPTSSTRRF
jgi:prolyl 4-hydroxylase